jgi:hypothetical protein
VTTDWMQPPTTDWGSGSLSSLYPPSYGAWEETPKWRWIKRLRGKVWRRQWGVMYLGECGYDYFTAGAMVALVLDQEFGEGHGDKNKR